MILNISEAANLGIHALVYLANKSHEEKPVRTSEVAEQYHVSENHLAKVFQRLARAGFVRSIRGPKGGFLLAKEPGDVTILAIYEAIDGQFNQTHICMLGKPTCGLENCIFGDMVERVNNEVASRFGHTTLGDLVSGKAQLPV